MMIHVSAIARITSRFNIAAFLIAAFLSAEPALAFDTTTMTVEKCWFHAAQSTELIQGFLHHYADVGLSKRGLSCIDAFGASGKVKALGEARALGLQL